MKNSNHLDALSSLSDNLKLNDEEAEQIYKLLGKDEIDTFFLKLEEFGETLPSNPDEIELLEWVKSLSEKSPSTYNALLKIIRENKALFDKIQDIFIDKIL
jgi:CRISPR/Cas system-associated endonuclease Cas3-HD